MVHNFFDIETSGSGIRNENISNDKIAEELRKPIATKFKIKAQSLFMDNIWGTNLADMQLINKLNKGICFLFCVTDIANVYGLFL